MTCGCAVVHRYPSSSLSVTRMSHRPPLNTGNGRQMASFRRRGSKWQVQVRRGGQTASRTFTLRADAAKWAAEAERSADRGELHDICRHAEFRCDTLGDVLTRYRNEVVPTHRSAANERPAIDAFIRDHSKLAGLTLDKLTGTDFASWRDRRLKSVKPSTVVREMVWLQHAIDTAMRDWGVPLTENVMKQVRRPRVDNKRERRLHDGEWERLLHAVEECHNSLMRPLIVLALETAMRRGELLSMCWQDFDEARSVVHLPKTKNVHARTVPLTREAVRVLKSLPRSDERILPISANPVRLAWDRLRRRAGVPDLRLHDLRHEAISRLVERGFSLAQVQQVSGHRSLQMLMRYTHLAVDDIVRALHAG